MSHRRAEPGSPEPLGSSFDGTGTNFALFSAHATAVDLCLFRDGAREERIRLPGRTGDIWHGRVEGVVPGARYLYRVHGPWRPDEGHRFDPSLAVLDPYARLLSASYAPKPVRSGAFPALRDRPSGVVVPDAAPIEHRRLCRPWAETVVYEAHVRGLTQRHPDIPEPLRGTYAALGHPAIVRHLQRLGVTALELLPIQAIADEPALLRRGLTNHWGYSTLNYFAPEPRYLGPPGPLGLVQAIRTLHDAGIEVILDVVLNHTAEIDVLGPTLSFRGVDNATYYKHRADAPGTLVDVTGCGNTLDLGHPVVRRMAVDALRHWADVYGVDGFRFDLAPALARDAGPFDPHSAFFASLAADPVLSRLKLIAEPWDVGEGGYRLGGFPDGWAEWNDRFRDANRGLWRGDPGQLARVTQGLAGSRETFAAGGRSPQASINYVCSHDGFTLRDLVSFDAKHNEANGEENRDGHGHNLSRNYGREGDTVDPAIRSVRARTVRALLATTVLAQGVPMLLAGDELSRSQGGNNNAYCQDNETSWLDWEGGRSHDPSLPDFVANLLALRRRFAAFRRDAFLTGIASRRTGLRDVYWLHPDGREMGWEDWQDSGLRTVGMQVGNEGEDGGRVLLVLHAGDEPVPFRLSPDCPGPAWTIVLDTTRADGRPGPDAPVLERGGTIAMPPRSVVLFQDTR